MKRTASIRFTERIGWSLGRLCRGYLRAEHAAVGSLVAKGWPIGTARALLLGVKVVLLVVLFYVAFWLALAVALMLLVVAIGHVYGALYEGMEWRYGPYGFGLYDDLDNRYDWPMFPEDKPW